MFISCLKVKVKKKYMFTRCNDQKLRKAVNSLKSSYQKFPVFDCQLIH